VPGPELTPNAVKAIVQYTATPLPSEKKLTQGTGEVNALGAVRLAEPIDTKISVGQL
jgi:hypothetical protein